MPIDQQRRNAEKEKREIKRQKILAVSSWTTAIGAMAGFFGLWHFLGQSQSSLGSNAAVSQASASQQGGFGTSYSPGHRYYRDGYGGTGGSAAGFSGGSGYLGGQGGAGISQSQMPNFSSSAS